MKTPYFNKERYAISMVVALCLIPLSNTSLANDSTVSLGLDISLPTLLSSKDSGLVSKSDLGQYLNNADDLVNIEQVSFSQTSINLLTDIQDRYLTIHYGKTEKIKAVYAYGGYGIAYQQEW